MSDLKVLVADGNSAAARRARVKLQPRDKKGRWVPTGAALLAAIRGLNGIAKKYKMKAIGGTATSKGEKNKIRALLLQDAPELGLKKNTVLEVDPKNGELESKIKLDRDYLKKKGIDPDLQHTLPKSIAEQPQDVSDMNPQPADDLDIELANGGLTDDEDKDFRKEREQEPLGKLPPGLETLEDSEVNKLVETQPSDGSPIDGDYSDSIVVDAMREGFYGGKPNIDELVDEAAAAPEEVSIKDLKPGDVISLGKQGNKRVVEVKPVGDRGEVELYVDDNGRIAKVGRLPGGAGVQRVRKAGSAQERPATEKPEKPKATRKPKAETPKPKPTRKPTRKVKKAPKSEEVNKPNRKDDGKMIAPSSKSVEELREKKINNLVDQDGKLLKVLNDKGKARAVEDPNAVIDALLEENPNAKIKEDGTVVMERGEFTDTDGKKYTYEVGVQRTVGNQFMERYTIKDPETGEVLYDFYNADYKDSFGGLYGKTSGLTRTRDLLLGKDIPGNKGTNSEGVPLDKEIANYFGPGKNIDQRLKYLRKTKDMNAWRLVTPEENIRKFLQGRSRLLNKSDNDSANYKSQFGNVRRSFVASTFEAIDLRDNELIKERLVQLLGRLPNTKESVDSLISTLKLEISERYKGSPREKELQTLPVNMKKFLEDVQFDLRARDEVPFVSEDGVSTVKVGDKVRFINNEGDMVVGEVVKLNAGSGKNGGFKDTARVKFGNQTVDNLQTRNMLHTEEDVTDYAAWVRNDEKLERRAEELGIDFEEYKRRKEDNPDFDPGDGEHAPADAGAPYLGEEGEEGNAGSDVPSFDKAAEELLSGDPLYNEDGDYIGTVIAAQEVPAKDGGEPGIAVKYLDTDGSEKVEVLDRGEVRSPK